MINRCNDCIHSKVCIYKEKYQEKYTTLENEFKNDEFFFIDLDCKIYEFSKLISIKELKLDINPLKPSNSCEGCPIYEYIKTGKSVVNDACSFCSKNPLKVGD